MSEKRKYEQKKRAESLAETRRRITEATVELHRTVGPAATHINEVARRAGVQRMTVYNHFPDDAALFTACSEHWRALHPAPGLDRWRAVHDPGARLRLGLRELYGWYRQTDPMTSNVLRDAEVLPVLHAVIESGLLRYLEQARAVLAGSIAGRGHRRERVHAAVQAATDIHTWRALAPLGDAGASELAAGLIELAAQRSPTH